MSVCEYEVPEPPRPVRGMFGRRRRVVRGSPIYVRSPDYLYPLQSDPSHPLLTGVGPDGRQVLVVPSAVVEFSPDGHLAATRDCPSPCALPAGFVERPIAVRRFWVPDRGLGISDAPVGLFGLPLDPSQFSEENWEFVRCSEFVQWGNYSLGCGCTSAGLNQLFVGRDGECLIHSV